MSAVFCIAFSLCGSLAQGMELKADDNIEEPSSTYKVTLNFKTTRDSADLEAQPLVDIQKRLNAGKHVEAHVNWYDLRKVRAIPTSFLSFIEIYRDSPLLSINIMGSVGYWDARYLLRFPCIQGMSYDVTEDRAVVDFWSNRTTPDDNFRENHGYLISQTEREQDYKKHGFVVDLEKYPYLRNLVVFASCNQTNHLSSFFIILKEVLPRLTSLKNLTLRDIFIDTSGLSTDTEVYIKNSLDFVEFVLRGQTPLETLRIERSIKDVDYRQPKEAIDRFVSRLKELRDQYHTCTVKIVVSGLDVSRAAKGRVLIAQPAEFLPPALARTNVTSDSSFENKVGFIKEMLAQLGITSSSTAEEKAQYTQAIMGYLYNPT